MNFMRKLIGKVCKLKAVYRYFLVMPFIFYSRW